MEIGEETVRLLVILQALLTIFLIVLFWFYTRLGRERLFGWWTAAWTAFGISFALGLLALEVDPRWSPFKGSLELVSVLVGFLHIPLLVLGAYSLEKPVSLSDLKTRLLLWLILMAGAVSFYLSLDFLSDPMASFSIRAVPSQGALGLAFFYCAWVFLRQWRKRSSKAAIVTGIACLLYGINQWAYMVGELRYLFTQLLPSQSVFFALSLQFESNLLLLDVVWEAGIGVGMILLLLDELEWVQTRTEINERQQAAVAELGHLALRSAPLSQLMETAVRLMSENLRAEKYVVLELLQDGQNFLFRAGTGWQEDYAGQQVVGLGGNARLGFGFPAEAPVFVEDLHAAGRYHPPPLLRDHGVVNGVSVTISGEEQPYGVLGAYSSRPRQDVKDDTHFLQAIANVLAEAIHRERAEKELQERTAYLDALTQESPLGIVALDSAGEVWLCNPAFVQLFGYQVKDFAERGLDEQIAPGETNPQAREFTDRVRSGQTAHFTTRRRHKDGTWIDVEVHAVPLIVGGKHAGSYGLYQDITERRALEKMKDEFLSMVSHDLRTPLTSIRGSLGLLAEGLLGTVPEKSKQVLNIAIENTERLVRLTGDILAFERMKAGFLPMKYEQCDAGNLITKAAETMQGTIRKMVSSACKITSKRTVSSPISIFPPRKTHGCSRQSCSQGECNAT